MKHFTHCNIWEPNKRNGVSQGSRFGRHHVVNPLERGGDLFLRPLLFQPECNISVPGAITPKSVGVCCFCVLPNFEVMAPGTEISKSVFGGFVRALNLFQFPVTAALRAGRGFGPPLVDRRSHRMVEVGNLPQGTGFSANH
jgi:hypothetical protein